MSLKPFIDQKLDDYIDEFAPSFLRTTFTIFRTFSLINLAI